MRKRRTLLEKAKGLGPQQTEALKKALLTMVEYLDKGQAEGAASASSIIFSFCVGDLTDGSTGLQVKERRTSRGLTQRQLAELVGTTQGIISRIENGTYLPPEDLLQRIWDALKTPSGPQEAQPQGSVSQEVSPQPSPTVETVVINPDVPANPSETSAGPVVDNPVQTGGVVNLSQSGS